MHKQKSAGCGANDQGDKYAPQSAVLVARQGSIICQVADHEYEGSGSSGRKYAPDVKVANSGALDPHRQRPEDQENGNNALTGPAAGREPYHQEAEMRQQRDAEGERRAPRPQDSWLLAVMRRGLLGAGNPRGEVNAAREAGHRGQDRHDTGRAGVARDPHPQKGDVPGHKRREDLSQGKETDRVHRSRGNRERVE